MPTTSLHTRLVAELAKRGMKVGIREVKSMVLQDVLPVMIQCSDDADYPLDAGVLWYGVEGEWWVLDPAHAFECSFVVGPDRIDSYWGTRIIAPAELCKSSEEDTDEGWEKKEMVKYDARSIEVPVHRIGTIMPSAFDLECGSCGAGRLGIQHLYMRGVFWGGAVRPVHCLLSPDVYFDSEAVETISSLKAQSILL